jgi:hypothetical protein
MTNCCYMSNIQKWKDACEKRCKICRSLMDIDLLKNGNYCYLAWDCHNKIRFQVCHKFGAWKINYPFVIQFNAWMKLMTLMSFCWTVLTWFQTFTVSWTFYAFFWVIRPASDTGELPRRKHKTMYLLGLLPCLSWFQRTCVLCLVIQRCNQKLWSQTCLVLWMISCEQGGDTSSPAETERGQDDSVTTSVIFTVSKTCLFNTPWNLHKEKYNKMQQHIKILLFDIYMKLNMFRATHRPSSGA